MRGRRSKNEAFLGVDVGTSAVKALIVDARGATLASAAEGLKLVMDAPLQAEQDAEGWWQATVAAIQRCLASAPKARIRAVGLTGQKHALLPLDANGRPLCRAMLWADGRAHAEANEIRSIYPAAGRRAGAHALPGLLLPKWLYLSRRHPDIAERTARLVFAKDWIRLRLTGTYATDRTEASATQLFDFRRNTWSQTLTPIFDLARSWLPPVHAPAQEAGVVDEDGAAATGLPVGTPVAAGAGDNETAALACGPVGGGVVAVILGTSGTVVGWHQYRSTAGGLVWNRHVLPTGYAATGTILSAGRSLEWIRKTAFARDTSMANVIEAARASDPAPAPLVFLPGLVGERSPVVDPLATGAFVGLRPIHTRGHLARAVLEGVALSIAEVLLLMRAAGVKVEELRLTSGGATSSLWRGLIAAAAGVPVRQVAHREGPAQGAAMLAACMTRPDTTIPDLAAAWVQPGPVEAPDEAAVQRLKRLGTLLRAARNALRGLHMQGG